LYFVQLRIAPWIVRTITSRLLPNAGMVVMRGAAWIRLLMKPMWLGNKIFRTPTVSVLCEHKPPVCRTSTMQITISLKALFAAATIIIMSLLAQQLPVPPGRFLLPTANEANMGVLGVWIALYGIRSCVAVSMMFTINCNSLCIPPNWAFRFGLSLVRFIATFVLLMMTTKMKMVFMETFCMAGSAPYPCRHRSDWLSGLYHILADPSQPPPLPPH